MDDASLILEKDRTLAQLIKYYYNVTYTHQKLIPTIMVSLIKPKKAQKLLAEHVRKRRLHLNLTQDELAQRSGVALSTLRKFEQQGTISLESYLKLHWVVGGLEDIIQASDLEDSEYTSIDDVLHANTQPKRQRGQKK